MPVFFLLAVIAAIVPSRAGAQQPSGSVGKVNSVPPVLTAPTAPTPEAGALNLQRVEITGSSDRDDRRDSTAAKIVLTRDDIVRFGDSSVADLLRRVPGVTIGGAPGRSGEIRMRGLGSGYTQVLLNGEPVAPGFSLESLSPALIDRIEVLRTSTADQSAQAIAGTINIILKQSVQKGQKDWKVAVESERGRPSAYLDGRLSERDGSLSYTLAGALKHKRNFWPSTVLQRGTDVVDQPILVRQTTKTEFEEISTVDLAPLVNWTVDDRNVVVWDGLVRYQRFTGGTLDERKTMLGSPPPYVGDSLRVLLETGMARSKVAWTHSLSDDAKLEVKLGISHTRRSAAATFDAFDSSDVLILNRNVRSVATDSSLTLGGKYRAPYREAHAFALGWDGEYSRRAEDRIQRDVTPTGLPPLNLDEAYVARVRRLALFAQDEWDITPRWSAYLGLRWEGLETHTAGNSLAVVQNRSGVLSPVIQTLWKVPDTKGDEVRLAISRTYKAPSTRDLIPRRYLTTDNTPTTPDFQGNPSLRPELAWGLEAAYERYFGDAGMASVNVFARRIEDVILKELININGAWVTRPVNHGNARVYGVEVEGKASLRKLVKTAPAIDLRVNLSRNWSAVDAVPGPNNRLDQQTPVSANVGMDYKLDSVPMTIGGNFGFQGSGPVRLSLTQSASTGVTRILDFYCLWKVNPMTHLRMSMSNILHQSRIEESTYSDATETLHQTTTSPAAVVLRLSLEIKL